MNWLCVRPESMAAATGTLRMCFGNPLIPLPLCSSAHSVPPGPAQLLPCARCLQSGLAQPCCAVPDPQAEPSWGGQGCQHSSTPGYL